MTVTIHSTGVEDFFGSSQWWTDHPRPFKKKIAQFGRLWNRRKIKIPRMDTPWKFNSSHLKICNPKRKGSSSNHHFFRGGLLNFEGLARPSSWKRIRYL